MDDIFDRESRPVKIACGQDILKGFFALWETTLKNAVRDDGVAMFSRFRLRWQRGTSHGSVEVPVEPHRNPALCKLRTWVYPPTPEEQKAPVKKLDASVENRRRNDVLLTEIAQIQLELVFGGDRSEKTGFSAWDETKRFLVHVEDIKHPDQLESFKP